MSFISYFLIAVGIFMSLINLFNTDLNGNLFFELNIGIIFGFPVIGLGVYTKIIEGDKVKGELYEHGE